MDLITIKTIERFNLCTNIIFLTSVFDTEEKKLNKILIFVFFVLQSILVAL